MYVCEIPVKHAPASVGTTNTATASASTQSSFSSWFTFSAWSFTFRLFVFVVLTSYALKYAVDNDYVEEHHIYAVGDAVVGAATTIGGKLVSSVSNLGGKSSAGNYELMAHDEEQPSGAQQMQQIPSGEGGYVAPVIPGL